jgi:hypothetical protein
MKVWHRKGDRTVLLLAGMAMIVAGTLSLVVLLTATADERGQAIALSASADAGVATIPGGSQPVSRELGPPPGREGSDDVARSAGRIAAGGDRESGGSDGAGDSTGHGGSSSSDPNGDLPAPPGETGGSEGGSGDTSVSVGDAEVTVDPDDTSATVTVGDTEVTVDPTDLLP